MPPGDTQHERTRWQLWRVHQDGGAELLGGGSGKGGPPAGALEQDAAQGPQVGGCNGAGQQQERFGAA